MVFRRLFRMGVTITGMCFLTGLFAACSSGVPSTETLNAPAGEKLYVEHDGMTELVGLCNTEADAEDIAQEYGISLKNFSYGVATFETDRDPQEIFDYGKKHKLPELSLNTIYHIQ